MPVAKAQSVFCRPSAKVDDEGEDNEADYGENFDGGENKFGFTIDGDRKNVEGDNDDDDDGDPSGDIDAVGFVPELDHDGGGRNFSTQRYGAGVPVL